MSNQPLAECLFHRSHWSVSCVDNFVFLHEETTHFSYSVDPLKNDASINWRWRRNTFFRKRFLLVYLQLKHTKVASALSFSLAIKLSIYFFTSIPFFYTKLLSWYFSFDKTSRNIFPWRILGKSIVNEHFAQQKVFLVCTDHPLSVCHIISLGLCIP